jgi:hypothetical protein
MIMDSLFNIEVEISASLKRISTIFLVKLDLSVITGNKKDGLN